MLYKNRCSPCVGYNCMEFASCADVSTNEDPLTECVCQLGRVKSGDGQECIIPPPTTPTPRPIPKLPPAVKKIASAITRTASTVLICFTAATLILFISLRVYEVARVIQMNMEIALIMAHLTLLLPAMYDTPMVSS